MMATPTGSNENRAKLLPTVVETEQEKQDHLDMDRAQDEGFNEPAQKESLEEAEVRERQTHLKQLDENKDKNRP